MQLFVNPGDALEGMKKTHFEVIKKSVDRATNDLLMNADWEAVLQCCDRINGCFDDEIISEIVFLLRRKLGCVATILNPVSTKQVQLTLNLTEALVKNCGARLHRAVNDATFMTEMKKVAKRYGGKSGAANEQVAELTLDIIQAWGEGFLTRRRQFPNIVDAYHELKKEGMPFKAQYDPSRVPIFTPDGASASSPFADSTEAILASVGGAAASSGGGGGGGGSRRSSSSGPGVETGNARSAQGGGSLPDALHTSLVILAELLLAAVNDGGELAQVGTDEVARELVLQITTQQVAIMDKMEALLMADASDAVAALFSLNDQASSVLEAHRGAADGSLSGAQVKALLSGVLGKVATEEGIEEKDGKGTTDGAPNSKDAASTGGASDLLDLDYPSPRTGSSSSGGGGGGGSNSRVDAKLPAQSNTNIAFDNGGGIGEDLLDFLSGPSTSAASSASAGAGAKSSAGIKAKQSGSMEAGAGAGAGSVVGSAPTDSGMDLLDFGASALSITPTPAPVSSPAPTGSAGTVTPKRRIVPLLPPPPGPSLVPPQSQVQEQPLQVQQQQQQQQHTTPMKTTTTETTNPFDLF